MEEELLTLPENQVHPKFQVGFMLLDLNVYVHQASKWDFNFGGQLATNSKNLVAKLKF